MRILHISLDTAMGGIESFLLNVYKLIDKEKIQFDFIEYGEVERNFNNRYTDLGAKIYILPDRKKNPLLASKKLKEIVKKYNYQVVHIHKNSLADISSIKICQDVGVSKIIVHSHNTYRDNKMVVLLHKINQKRLEYLEKTIKLIDIANRIDERLEGNDAKEILKVIGGYSKALNLLDDYDHRTLKKFEGNIDDRKIEYQECINIINKLRFNEESSLFAVERDKGLESIIGNIYQSFARTRYLQEYRRKRSKFFIFNSKKSCICRWQ